MTLDLILISFEIEFYMWVIPTVMWERTLQGVPDTRLIQP